jgi:hypothetical protein
MEDTPDVTARLVFTGPLHGKYHGGQDDTLTARIQVIKTIKYPDHRKQQVR